MKASWFGRPRKKRRTARSSILRRLNRLIVFICATPPPVVKYFQLICQNQMRACG